MSYARDGRGDRSVSPRGSASPRRGRRSRSLSRSPRRRSRSADSGDALNPGNNLYVTGLSTRVTTRELEEFFGKEGKVLECQLVTDPRTRESRGFGFVTMETTEDAERCIKYLNRSVLEGRLVTVEKAKRKRGRTPTPGKYQGIGPRRGHGAGHGAGRGPRRSRSRSYSPRGRYDRDPYPRDRDRPRYNAYERYRKRSSSPRDRSYSRAY